MKMYLLNVSYTKGLEEVGPHIKAHGEWVDQCRRRDLLLFAGPKKDGLGGVIAMRSMDKGDLLRLIAEDAYMQNDVAEYQIIDFDCKAAQTVAQALIGS